VNLQPGQRFGSRYTIIRMLGVGGMGAVYQAWDESLGMPVALKTIKLPPGIHPLDAQELEERFKRELRLARQVTHPNVVRIHDLGEVGPVKFLTMAYVQGADLAGVLRTHGRLPVERALAIARQVAAGLAAAHEAGVVHRDLKPANVLIDGEQRALLTDFGIARAADGMPAQTIPGAVIGTFGYMAPEQARGELADQRSDVYACGLILYELLAGKRPRAGGDPSLTQPPPPPVGEAAPATPPGLARIVDRCLQPDPAARYQNATELLADLNDLEVDGTVRRPPVVPRRSRALPLAAAGILGAVLVSGAWWVAKRGTEAPPQQAARAPVSVLIANFENKAGDPVFEGSLEQALGIAVEGASFITTYSRNSAADVAKELKGSAVLDPAAARLVALREGIALVLAGSIERQGSGYRLRISLLEPSPGGEARTVERTAPDKAGVLDAVARLAGEIRTALGDTTPSAELRAETYSASSLEAVHAYSLAQDLTTDSRNEEAIAHYRAAIGHDPQFGRAYAGWAAAAYDLGRRAEAEELWKKALSLMDRMTAREKYRTLGGYFMNVARNYDKAIENYTELVRQYPADSAGWNNLAVAHFFTLDFAKALEEGRRAIEIYPKSAKFRVNYALYAMYAGDFATAADNAAQVIKTDPKYDSAYLPVAMAAAAAGDLAKARGAYERAKAAGPAGTSLAGIGAADLALFAGRAADAIALLEAGIHADTQDGNAFGAATKSAALAEALLAVGRTRDAARAAEAALAGGIDEFAAVPAARVLTAAGHEARVTALARELESRGQPLPRAYADIVRGEQALARGRPADALGFFTNATRTADVWLARFGAGVAYVEAGRHAEALSELEACVKRRGEATALFLDDVPTWRYTAAVPYWLGRAQQGLGMTAAAARSFEAFLRSRDGGGGDPLMTDARARAATLGGGPAQ
jgi:tetratricopeptide (TPR) repeat protein